jgi:hypothetical protein
MPQTRQTENERKIMKTKNQIKVPRKATHVAIIDAAGKSGKMQAKDFAALTQSEIESMGVKVQFICGTGKRAKVIGETVIAVSGEIEAIATAICDDATRADGGKVEADIVTAEKDTIPDELTNAVPTWNSKEVAPIGLRNERNILARFEYVPQPLVIIQNDKKIDSGFAVLACSDNGKIVGKAFNPKTYGLLNNADFIGVTETLCAVLDKMGMKYQIATTGTLMGRERSFISIQLSEQATFKIGERVFQAFLNCLNSIPSNTGCTVTFANNTFCVCCRNTFAHALQCADGTKFHAAIKHTSGMKAALADVPVLVESYLSGNEKLFKTLGAFSVFPVTAEMAENYFAAFIGRDGKGELTDKTKLSTRSAGIVETLKGLHVRGKGNKGETALDLFSAVTEYFTHYSAGKSENALKQYTSSEAGDGYVSKGEFYSWLVKHIQSQSAFAAVAKVGETLLVSYRKDAKTKA